MSSMIHKKKSNPWPTIIFICFIAMAWYWHSNKEVETKPVKQETAIQDIILPTPITQTKSKTKHVIKDIKKTVKTLPKVVKQAKIQDANKKTIPQKIDMTNIDELYQQIVKQEPPLYNRFKEVRDLIQKNIFICTDKQKLADLINKLEEVNKYLIYHANGSDFQIYTVKPGDSLAKIGKLFGHNHGLIMKVNNLTSTNIRIGQELRIPLGMVSIVIIKKQYKLYLMLGKNIIKAYDIGLGKMNSTPEGTFIVTTKLIDPEWTYAGKVIPGGAPDNELGTRWIGISEKGYGIHGTLYPETIGKSASRGCVRLINKDVEDLFAMVPRKSTVIIK